MIKPPSVPMSLADLYQKILLEHYRNPRNYGELSGDCLIAEEHNPVCGDQVKLMIAVRRGMVHQIRFTARGCALSIASASIMTELLTGKALKEVHSISTGIMEVFRHKRPVETLENFGEMSVLGGVVDFPARIKCVLLCWHALEAILEIMEKR